MQAAVRALPTGYVTARYRNAGGQLLECPQLKNISDRFHHVISDATGHPVVSYGYGEGADATYRLAVHFPALMNVPTHQVRDIWSVSAQQVVERPADIFAALGELIESHELSEPQAMAFTHALRELCYHAIGAYERQHGLGFGGLFRFRDALDAQFADISAAFAAGDHRGGIATCEFASKVRYQSPDLTIDAGSAQAIHPQRAQSLN